jgi:hypothetical protein
MTLTFSSVGHVYKFDGRVVPSVTQVLAPLERSFEYVDPDYLERAREFGQHVHKAIELFNLGELDEVALDPALVPYLEQWKKFIFDTGFEVTENEQAVYHTQLKYAGRLDVRGLMRKRLYLIDLKSGAVPKTCQLQCAGYVLASEHGARIRRAALQICPNGAPRYNLIPYQDPADFSFFQSALNLYRWRENNGH